MKTRALLFALIISISHLSSFAADWEMKKAKLMTSWSQSIDPENVLPEYPRPQMERAEWINLNGIWDCLKGSINDASYIADRTFDKKILVPFPVESAISGIMDTENSNKDKFYWYKRSITIPSGWKNKDILLHIGGADWQCSVYVNGTKVGVHEGAYDPFYFNITDYLTEAEEQELVISVYDPSPLGGQPFGKQTLTTGGIFYTPVSGIWQTVWLEPVSKTHISNFKLTPNIDNSTIKVNVASSETKETLSATVKIFDGEDLLSETTVPIDEDNNMEIDNPKLWSPSSPFLYDMQITLKENGTVLDEINTYFGMRKIHSAKKNGVPAFFLNNEPVFQLGTLDQGWWPDGLYTAPSDEALLFDIEKTKELGFNMIRKHIKTEPARWYYHCDRLGILVWQDIPNAETQARQDANWSKDRLWVEANFLREMENIMNSLINFPCITTWVVFNEGFGQYSKAEEEQYRQEYTIRAVNTAKSFDNSRLFNAASGWFDYEIGDIIDMHSYPKPGLHDNPVNKRVSVCGEYGGINLEVKNHMWGGNDMGYASVENASELADLFSEYLDIIQYKKLSGMRGAVYTQITDVENEINGLMTYDRIPKWNTSQTNKVRAAIEDCIENTYEYYTIIPTSKSRRQQWKYYTGDTPGSSWYKDSFDDSLWKTGYAGFGSGYTPNATANTNWNTSTIYIRKTFELGNVLDEVIDNMFLEIYHDEDFEVYINGIKCAEAKGHVSSYVTHTISDRGKKAIKKNASNVIAIKCSQTSGGQFIDAGLVTNVDPTLTSIEAVVTDEELELYPNPAKNTFSVKAPDDLSKLELYSLGGNLLKQYSGGASSYSLSSIDSGVYLVKAYTFTNNIYTQKLIIENK